MMGVLAKERWARELFILRTPTLTNHQLVSIAMLKLSSLWSTEK